MGSDAQRSEPAVGKVGGLEKQTAPQLLGPLLMSPQPQFYTVSVGVHPGNDTEGLGESVSKFRAGWDKS